MSQSANIPALADERRTTSRRNPAASPRSRDRVFDVLRTLGLLSILLAHVNPPPVLWLIRDFDVPLLVLVSGAVCQLGYRGRPIVFGRYVWKRVVRLLVPVYLFLAAYFIVMKAVAPARFDAEVIQRTFLLLNGMGYVWIIRVFLLVALLTPFLLRWRQRLSPFAFYSILFGAYGVHEALWAFLSGGDQVAVWDGIKYTVFYALPYGCLFGLGLRWPGMSRRVAFAWAAAGFGVAAIILSVMQTWPTIAVAATLKYPPHLAYFWYGLGMSHLLYGIGQGLPKMPQRIEKGITWISASSLWIYLWHIPGLQVARKIMLQIDLGEWSFLGLWALTAGFAMTMTLIQQRGVRWVVQKAREESRLTRALEIAFLN